MKIEAPTPCVRQLSTKDERGEAMLSVVAKRTYTIADSACVVADEQVPLLALALDPADEMVLHDADIWPIKPMTDVVVLGHAYAYGGGLEILASVAVQALVKEIAVIGDREATRTDGRIVFSEPARFERMPLEARRAYGGHDRVSERLRAFSRPEEPPHKAQVNQFTPYRYPRNGVGKGFVVDGADEALAAAGLPNLEDPTDRLTPDRIVAGSPEAWSRMPLPWTTVWQDPGDFPRYGYLGMIASLDGPREEIAEVRRGFVSQAFPARLRGPLDKRFFNGGSLGLQLPQVVADAAGKLTFKLKNMHPTRRELSFSLPKGAPTIRTGDHRGALTATDPVIHHVVIEPDLDRVTVVWRGAARARRGYTLGELRTLPLEVVWS